MRKYLIVGPSWVGDMVMAQSLFKLLHSRYPGSVIDVIAPAWSTPILERMPEVRHSITLKTGHGEFRLSERWQLGRTLRTEAYTHSITLPRSWKSALVPFAAGVPVRTGFHGEQRFFLLNDRRTLDKQILNQTVKRFTFLGLDHHETLKPEHLHNPTLKSQPERWSELAEKFSLPTQQKAIALMPGAEYGPAKQWPLEYFHTLAQQLDTLGYQIWVIGGPKDQTAGDIISQGLNNTYNLCGKTSLSDAVDLLAKAEQAVSNDSGLMHVAAATGTRVHGIYGSSSPEFTPPLTDNKAIYTLHLECSPCFKRQCPLGHLACLRDIKPDALIQGLNL